MRLKIRCGICGFEGFANATDWLYHYTRQCRKEKKATVAQLAQQVPCKHPFPRSTRGGSSNLWNS